MGAEKTGEQSTTQHVVIGELPIASNICNQELREVIKSSGDEMSVAHVIMEPSAQSLLHKHRKMEEIYHILDGDGELIVGEQSVEVGEGSVVLIPRNTPHKLINSEEGTLTHLVFAIPAFDPDDIYLLEEIDE